MPEVLDYTYIDTWEKIKDDDAFGTSLYIMRTEGLLVGGSAGSAIAGALRYLKSPEGFERFGNVEGTNVVVILAARGREGQDERVTTDPSAVPPRRSDAQEPDPTP